MHAFCLSEKSRLGVGSPDPLSLAPETLPYKKQRDFWVCEPRMRQLSFSLCQSMGNRGTGQLTWGVFDCGVFGILFRKTCRLLNVLGSPLPS